jgi:hypothetical protein
MSDNPLKSLAEYSHCEVRMYWYDDFPHPGDVTLASTFPHHKHVAPDIRRHRIPALGMSFTRPNLAVLIQEIQGLLKQQLS